MTDDQLPPLPLAAGYCRLVGGATEEVFTAFQMREFAERALASAPPQAAEVLAAQPDEAIELASALEQQRAYTIVAAVRGLRPQSDMPAPFDAGYDLACEEIEHRLRTEQWELEGGIAVPIVAPSVQAEQTAVAWMTPSEFENLRIARECRDNRGFIVRPSREPDGIPTIPLYAALASVSRPDLPGAREALAEKAKALAIHYGNASHEFGNDTGSFKATQSTKADLFAAIDALAALAERPATPAGETMDAALLDWLGTQWAHGVHVEVYARMTDFGRLEQGVTVFTHRGEHRAPTVREALRAALRTSTNGADHA